MAVQVFPFTESDWNCFAGAEEWKDGSAPLIGTDGTRTLVMDADGAEVYFGDGEQYLRLSMKFPTQKAAVAFAAGLPENFDAPAYGFTE